MAQNLLLTQHDPPQKWILMKGDWGLLSTSDGERPYCSQHVLVGFSEGSLPTQRVLLTCQDTYSLVISRFKGSQTENGESVKKQLSPQVIPGLPQSYIFDLKENINKTETHKL